MITNCASKRLKIEQLFDAPNSTTDGMVVVAISELGKLAALKKKRQLVDKKVVQDAINQFNGTESDHKDDISIDDKEAAELIIYRLGLRIDENYIATVAHSPSTFTSRSH